MCKELYSAGEIRAKHEKILQVFSETPTYELQYRDLEHAIYQLDILAKIHEPAGHRESHFPLRPII
jgi:hypothetical protein